MQNMRLLDLQTGKYLSLGKNWLYGEDWIVLTSFMPLYNRVQDAWFIETNEGSNITNARYLISELPQPLKTLCERVWAVVYGERYVLIYGKIGSIVEQYKFYVTGHREAEEYLLLYMKNTIMHITPTQEFEKDILIREEVVKKYELDREYDRACVKEEDKRINDKRFYNRLGERTVDDIDSSHEVKDVITGNIFEEYSKQLRNEPNKFEELLELIK